MAVWRSISSIRAASLARALSVVCFVCLVGAQLGAPAASANPRYPVPWTFAAAIPAGAENGPNVPPPGANIPCAPSRAHPDPVVLVHGLGGDENDNWQTMSPFLADNGYCVYALTYGNATSEPSPFDKFGGLGDMVASAKVLASFVGEVLHKTGASKVDIVGHSEGGTMPDYYIKFLGGYKVVAHFVAISGVLHGTDFWGLSSLYEDGQGYGYSQEYSQEFSKYCTSCLEFFPTSKFMEELDSPDAPGAAASCPVDGASVDGVSYTSLATNNDELVRPPTSDFIDPRCGNATNILVQHQCPTDQADHLSMAADPVVAQDVLNALDPAHMRWVRCAVVLPAVG
ncbi:MAG TPA: alpha/beta fold hydrolase [Acidimicrobiales bacterium]|nr:alpha/beta fold hydrolase [Acidimicrobiales bacterium]